MLASTDTVAVLTLITADKYQVMNSILFGEGVVNDAVTILLYQAVNRQVMKMEQTMHNKDQRNGDLLLTTSDILGMCGNFFSLSFQSVLMGIFVGLLAARLLRDINMDYDSVKQTTLMMLFAYLGYLCAE